MDASRVSGRCSAGPQRVKGSCLFRLAVGGDVILCTEFTGSEYTLDAIEGACAPPSQVSTAPCPVAGLAGKCVDRCGEPSESIGYIYRATAEAVERGCAAHDPPGFFVR